MSKKGPIMGAIGGFLAGYFLGMKEKSPRIPDTRETIIEHVVKRYKLNQEETTFIKEALAEDAVLEAFKDFFLSNKTLDESINQLWAPLAEKKISAIKNIDPKVGSILTNLGFTLDPASRVDRLNKFIVDHSENEIIDICSEIMKKHKDIYKSEKAYEELLRRMNCFPNHVEQTILAISKLFFQKDPPNMNLLMDFAEGKITSEDIKAYKIPNKSNPANR